MVIRDNPISKRYVILNMRSSPPTISIHVTVFSLPRGNESTMFPTENVEQQGSSDSNEELSVMVFTKQSSLAALVSGLARRKGRFRKFRNNEHIYRNKPFNLKVAVALTKFLKFIIILRTFLLYNMEKHIRSSTYGSYCTLDQQLNVLKPGENILYDRWFNISIFLV